MPEPPLPPGTDADEEESAKWQPAPNSWTYTCGRDLGEKLLAGKGLFATKDRVLVVGLDTTDKLLEDGLIEGLLSGVAVLEKLNLHAGESAWMAPNQNVFYVSPITPANMAYAKDQGVNKIVVYRLVLFRKGSIRGSEVISTTAGVTARVLEVPTGTILATGAFGCKGQ